MSSQNVDTYLLATAVGVLAFVEVTSQSVDEERVTVGASTLVATDRVGAVVGATALVNIGTFISVIGEALIRNRKVLVQ